MKLLPLRALQCQFILHHHFELLCLLHPEQVQHHLFPSPVTAYTSSSPPPLPSSTILNFAFQDRIASFNNSPHTSSSRVSFGGEVSICLFLDFLLGSCQCWSEQTAKGLLRGGGGKKVTYLLHSDRVFNSEPYQTPVAATTAMVAVQFRLPICFPAVMQTSHLLHLSYVKNELSVLSMPFMAEEFLSLFVSVWSSVP